MKTTLSMRGKLFAGIILAGIVFSLLSTVTTNLLVTYAEVSFPSNVSGIISGLLAGEPIAFGITFALTAIVGFYIWIFGFIGAWLKTKVTREGKIKLQKRPAILGFFLVGGLAIIIFGIVDEAVASVGASTDPTELLTTLAELNIIGFLINLVAMAVIGTVAIALGTKFTTIEGWLPKTLTKDSPPKGD